MARRAQSTPIRKNVSLTPTSDRRIRRIREYTNCSTDADAIRHVLDVYDELMTVQIRGYDIVLEPQNAEVGKRPIAFRRLFDQLAVDIDKESKEPAMTAAHDR